MIPSFSKIETKITSAILTVKLHRGYKVGDKIVVSGLVNDRDKNGKWTISTVTPVSITLGKKVGFVEYLKSFFIKKT